MLRAHAGRGGAHAGVVQQHLEDATLAPGRVVADCLEQAMLDAGAPPHLQWKVPLGSARAVESAFRERTGSGKCL